MEVVVLLHRPEVRRGRTVTFAFRLRSLRGDLSISALATAAGISRQSIDLLERGERQPSLETAERLATALGKKLRVFEGCGIPTPLESV